MTVDDIREMPRASAVWIAILIGTIFGIVAFAFVHPLERIGYDFQAFWCGADAIVHHADPYLNQPLHACEASHTPAFFLTYPNVTIPAPLPPYALALFAPFTVLPFALARAIWWIAIVGSALLAAKGIARFSGMPYIAALMACCLALLGPALVQGALAPVPIAIIIWGAIALRERRWDLATVLLTLAMIEPHMALPACVAAMIFVPTMRGRLLIGAALASGVALLAVGPAVCLEYFTRLLPLHAIAEVNNLGQDSLTTILYHLGLPAASAVHIGSAQYALLCVAGIVAGARYADRDGDRSWLVILPAAFAVVGGEFIHLSEVAMLLPLACAMAIRRPSWLSYAALIGLAIPWESVINWSLLSPAAALVLAWLLARRGVAPWIVVTTSFALIPLAVWAHGYAAAGAGFQSGAYVLTDPGANVLASLPWQRFNDFSVVSAPWWPEKILTLVPAIVLVWLAVRDTFARRQHVGKIGEERRQPEASPRQSATAGAAS